jgi:predicted methyltransferase
MMTSDDAGAYHLGYSDAEAERLVRQGRYINGMTDQFFRSSGIEAGQRVLDVGSGVGEVALILSRLVGPSGKITFFQQDFLRRCGRPLRFAVLAGSGRRVAVVVGDA